MNDQKRTTQYYSLDGDKVDFQELIRVAKLFGYVSNDGIYTTSEAARVLRDNGIAVDCWQNDTEE
jgi:hypothetical protein